MAGVEPLQPGLRPQVRTLDASALREQTDYTVFIRARGQGRVALQHRDPVIRQGLDTLDDGRVVHGVVNFGTQVGESRFVVLVDGRPHVAFSVEVCPSKMGYRSDYTALRDDVQAIAQALVLEYVRATHQEAEGQHAAAVAPTTWLLLLRQHVDLLQRGLMYVAQHPYRGTVRAVQPTSPERIRHPDTAVRRALQRALQRAPTAALPSHRAHLTLDTPAHRWLATQAFMIQQRLGTLYRQERQLPSSVRRRATLDEMEMLQAQVARLRRLPPLREAEPLPPAEPPLSLLTAPGYREAYRACLMLRKALHLTGPSLEASLKDLHQLYEYWCFLTLVHLAADLTVHPLPAASLLHVTSYGISLRLRRGRHQALRLGLADGRHLTLAYNPRFGGKGYLVPQQPDIVLTLHPPQAPPQRYILDAKYRLDASAAYVRRYGTPGPPTDALNDLHRYRDAIVDAALRRSVVQAVALFPWREPHPDAFLQSRHGQALDDVGVGALPLLPGATHYLKRWLEQILA